MKVFAANQKREKPKIQGMDASPVGLEAWVSMLNFMVYSEISHKFLAVAFSGDPKTPSADHQCCNEPPMPPAQEIRSSDQGY